MTVAIGESQVPGHGTPVGVQTYPEHGVPALPGPDEPEVVSEDDEPEGQVNATDAAVEKAAELDVDLDTVEGTGADGKVTAPDVESAAEKQTS